jgi:hypothetical protein
MPSCIEKRLVIFLSMFREAASREMHCVRRDESSDSTKSDARFTVIVVTDRRAVAS